MKKWNKCTCGPQGKCESCKAGEASTCGHCKKPKAQCTCGEKK